MMLVHEAIWTDKNVLLSIKHKPVGFTSWADIWLALKFPISVVHSSAVVGCSRASRSLLTFIRTWMLKGTVGRLGSTGLSLLMWGINTSKIETVLSHLWVTEFLVWKVELWCQSSFGSTFPMLPPFGGQRWKALRKTSDRWRPHWLGVGCSMQPLEQDTVKTAATSSEAWNQACNGLFLTGSKLSR